MALRADHEIFPVAADVDYRLDSGMKHTELGLATASQSGQDLHLFSLPRSGTDSLSAGPSADVYSVVLYMQVCAGDFDGNICLGAPALYTYSQIVEPMVILNAPPVHFDILNGTEYDITGCFAAIPRNCPFVSTYRYEQSRGATVERTYTRDWGVSAAASAEVQGRASVVNVKVEAELTAEYGEQFSKTSSAGETYTVGTRVTATADDWLFATVVNYNLWEYPVYQNDLLTGHVMVVEPTVTHDTWFSAHNSPECAYAPDHEVGNILSYPSDITSNPRLEELIRNGIYYQVTDGSQHDWWLEFSHFQSSGASETKEYEMGASMAVEASTVFGGARVEVSGQYGGSDIRTKQTAVTSSLRIDVSLGGINSSLGQASYTVEPCAYWARNGALVVDYAVTGGLGAWWNGRYGDSCDVTFILPWKYDPEKGSPLEFETSRQQTTDIRLYPILADEGDTVSISARIRNFALKTSSRPVGVRFYVGDPDSGGTPISALDGSTLFHTAGAVPSRGMGRVDLQWRIPAGIGASPRIYGVIDPGDSIPEIHENNNKGWTQFFTASGTTADRMRPRLHRVRGLFRCMQTGPVMTVTFHLVGPERVHLSLFDMRGREVMRLLPGRTYAAGTHRVTFSMDDGGRRAGGALVLVGRAGSERWSQKMLVVR